MKLLQQYGKLQTLYCWDICTIIKIDVSLRKYVSFMFHTGTYILKHILLEQ